MFLCHGEIVAMAIKNKIKKGEGNEKKFFWFVLFVGNGRCC